MSTNVFGKRNNFNNHVTYGQVGVNISDVAGQIAKEMEAKKVEMIQKQREDSEKPREADPAVYFIARKVRTGYRIESIESYGKIGEIQAVGATIPIAIANARFAFIQRLMLLKSAESFDKACERVANMTFEVADTLGGEKKIITSG